MDWFGLSASRRPGGVGRLVFTGEAARLFFLPQIHGPSGVQGV
jgi:hypothetical protein